MKEERINQLQLLISRRDIDALARPCITDDAEAERYIAEAEQIDLAPQLGADLFIRVKRNPQEYDILLNGGAWREKEIGEGAWEHICAGLRKALAYYAYARIVRNGGHVATRFGFNDKRDEFSNAVELKQRVAEANSAYAVAVEHLNTCVAYARAKGLIDCNSAIRNTTNPKYRIIKG